MLTLDKFEKSSSFSFKKLNEIEKTAYRSFVRCVEEESGFDETIEDRDEAYLSYVIDKYGANKVTLAIGTIKCGVSGYNFKSKGNLLYHTDKLEMILQKNLQFAGHRELINAYFIKRLSRHSKFIRLTKLKALVYGKPIMLSMPKAEFAQKISVILYNITVEEMFQMISICMAERI